TSRNNAPQSRTAGTIFRRRASRNVRCAIARILRMWSARPLVLAHDFDEPLLERLAPALELVNRNAAAHEPARDLRHRALVLNAHVHDAVARLGRAAAERREPFEHAPVGGIDLELDVERGRRGAERELADHAAALEEHDAVAGGFHLAEQMRVQE